MLSFLERVAEFFEPLWWLVPAFAWRFQPGDCCGQAVPPGDDCNQCTGVTPKYLKLTITAGSLGGTSTAIDCPCDCADVYYPQVYILTQDSVDPCKWAVTGCTCQSGTVFDSVTATLSGTTVTVVVTRGNDTVTYTATMADCDNFSDSLTYSSGGTECTGWSGLSMTIASTADMTNDWTCSLCGYTDRESDPDNISQPVVTLKNITGSLPECGGFGSTPERFCSEMAGTYGLVAESACQFSFTGIKAATCFEVIDPPFVLYYCWKITLNITYDYDTKQHTAVLTVATDYSTTSPCDFVVGPGQSGCTDSATHLYSDDCDPLPQCLSGTGSLTAPANCDVGCEFQLDYEFTLGCPVHAATAAPTTSAFGMAATGTYVAAKSGTAAVTAGGATAAGTGLLTGPAVSATGSPTTGGATVSASGTTSGVDRTGTAAITTGGATAAASGTTTIATRTGTASPTAGAATASGSGTTSIAARSGTAAVTTGGATSSGSGSGASANSSGTAAVTAGGATASASGTTSIAARTGTAAVTTGGATSAGSGTGGSTRTATGAPAAGGATVAASGTTTIAARSGSVAASTGGATASGSGTFTGLTRTATAAVVAGGATTSGSGTTSIAARSATGSPTAGGATAAGSGTFTELVRTATGTPTAGGATASGSGTFTELVRTATAAITAGGATASGTGAFTELVRTATGTPSTGGTTASGSGTFTELARTGTAAITAGGATASGVGVFTELVRTATGGGNVGGATASGTGTLSGCAGERECEECSGDEAPDTFLVKFSEALIDNECTDCDTFFDTTNKSLGYLVNCRYTEFFSGPAALCQGFYSVLYLLELTPNGPDTDVSVLIQIDDNMGNLGNVNYKTTLTGTPNCLTFNELDLPFDSFQNLGIDPESVCTGWDSRSLKVTSGT